MMRLKKEPIILAVVIAGLVLYLMMRDRDRTNYELPDIREVQVDGVSGIEISGPSGDIALERTGDKWFIAPQGYPADNDMVKEMLEIIRKPVLAAMVSESGNYVRYGLDKDRGITVKAFKAGALERALEIGYATDDRRRTFVRVGNDPRVFHSLDNIRSAFEKETEDLRDKGVLSFDVKDITGITITEEDQTLQLTLDKVTEQEGTKEVSASSTDRDWRDEEGRDVDGSSVERLLSMLSGLSCERYLYDITREGLSAPLCTVRLTGDKGEYTLSVFSRTGDDDSLYPSVSSGNDYAFMLKGTRAEELINARDNILKTGE